MLDWFGNPVKAARGYWSDYKRSDRVPVFSSVWDQMPRYGPVWTRPANRVDTIIVHHSGADGAPGVEGAVNSAQYLVNVAKRKERERRGKYPGYDYPYPAGPAYTYWIPSSAPDGVEVYMTNPANYWTMHSNKLNKRGLAVCLQGNHQRLQGNDKRWQYEVLCLLLDYLKDAWGITPRRIVGHNELNRLGGHAKPSCPGPVASAIVEAYREKFL